MATAYRLRAGDTGPVQQSPVTCGSACLTVARMLVDPIFASWVRTGSPRLPGSPEGDTEAERFAAYEGVVMRRTNGIFTGHHRLNAPWPRALGTPPWGAKRELEYGAATQGTRYDVAAIRHLSDSSLRGAFEHLVDVVAEDEPGLLYVGTRHLPRHVVLVLPGDGDRVLDVYDPGTGRVDHLRRDTVVERRVALSGWQIPWFIVQPTGHRRVRAFSRAPSLSGARVTSGA